MQASSALRITPLEFIEIALRKPLDEYESTGCLTLSTVGVAAHSAETPAQSAEPASLPSRCPAWRVGIGWTEGHNPPPTPADLLPADMLEKLLDLWLVTGTNVLYTSALGILGRLEEGGPEALSMIANSMEADIYDRIDALQAKWEGGQAV